MVPQQLVSCAHKIFYSERFCSLGAGAVPASAERLAAGPPVLSGLLVASHRSIVLILLSTCTIRSSPRGSTSLLTHYYQENNTTAWHFVNFLVSFYCVTVQPSSMAEDHSQTETASRLLTWGKTGRVFFTDLRGFSRIWSARYKQPVFCVMPKCKKCGKSKFRCRSISKKALLIVIHLVQQYNLISFKKSQLKYSVPSIGLLRISQFSDTHSNTFCWEIFRKFHQPAMIPKTMIVTWGSIWRPGKAFRVISCATLSELLITTLPDWTQTQPFMNRRMLSIMFYRRRNQ